MYQSVCVSVMKWRWEFEMEMEVEYVYISHLINHLITYFRCIKSYQSA